ncbi:MAG: hypothetical protein HC857_13175 [Synechococcales cyanobacterium RU_4_20]|nr:hypothetical protein [Synechococcales cyanobacterium RU_4_20]
MLNSFPETSTAVGEIPKFKDLSPQHWAYKAMRLAYQKRILVGYPDNTLRPDRPISRAEAIAILYNLVSPPLNGAEVMAWNLPRFPLPDNPDQILNEQFEDAAQIPSWAKPSLSGAAAGFMVVDYPQGRNLRPQDATTRAEAAAFLCQASEIDGLVPVTAIVGTRKFVQSAELQRLFRARVEGKQGWFDTQRQVAVIAQAIPGWQLLSLGKPQENRVAAWFNDASQVEKKGFLDHQGRVAIAPQFEAAGDFSEGLAWVQKNGKVGFIDSAGQVVIPLKFDQAQPFQENLAAVRADDKWGFIDRQGSWVIPAQFYQVAPFSEGLARIEATPIAPFTPSKFGFINRTGQTVIEPQFREAESFSSGLAYVSSNPNGSFSFQEKYYITPTGQRALPDLSDAEASFSEGLVARRVERHEDPLQLGKVEYGYANPQGQWAISPQTLVSQSGLTSIQQAGPFQSGFAVIKSGDRFGIINRQGKLVAPPIFSRIDSIENGYAYVNYGGRMMSYIAGYDSSATPFSGQDFRGGRWGYIKL